MLTKESRRTAVYIGGGALLVAWLAAANSPQHLAPLPAAPAPLADPSGDLAANVDAQARRLKQRLNAAPAPTNATRNPFTFAPQAPAVRAESRAPRTVPLVDVPPPLNAPLALTLMGIAQEPSPEGTHRTAVIGGPADAIYMVMEGQAFADRYQVKTIGVDAIELKDLMTGGYRRLALR